MRIPRREPTGHLPDRTHPGTVRLEVASLERSLMWYREVLGLEELHRETGLARLGTPDGVRPLVELRERPGARPVPPRGRLGLFHFAILLPDRAALGRFCAHVLALGGRPGAADHLVSEALYLHDPDGLGVEVYADRPRERWDVRGGEVGMATLPLDLEDLAAAGDGEHWEGVPRGTSMGHVHLHVGDLPTADAFYHGLVGFERTATSYPGALFLAAGGYHHHLGVNTWAGPQARPAAPGEARLLEWELVLPHREDVMEVVGRLRAAGLSPTLDGSGDPVRIADPWGTTLCLDWDPHPD